MAKVSIYQSPYTGAIPKAKKKPVITGTSTAVKTSGLVSEPVTAQTVAQPSVVTEPVTVTTPTVTPTIRRANSAISTPVSSNAIRPPANITPTSTIKVQNAAAGSGGGSSLGQGGAQSSSNQTAVTPPPTITPAPNEQAPEMNDPSGDQDINFRAWKIEQFAKNPKIETAWNQMQQAQRAQFRQTLRSQGRAAAMSFMRGLFPDVFTGGDGATPGTEAPTDAPPGATGYAALTPEQRTQVDGWMKDPAAFKAALAANPNDPVVMLAKERFAQYGGVMPDTIESITKRLYGTIEKPAQSETILSKNTENVAGKAADAPTGVERPGEGEGGGGTGGGGKPKPKPEAEGPRAGTFRELLASRPGFAERFATLSTDQKAQVRQRFQKKGAQAARLLLRQLLGLVEKRMVVE